MHVPSHRVGLPSPGPEALRGLWQPAEGSVGCGVWEAEVDAPFCRHPLDETPSGPWLPSARRAPIHVPGRRTQFEDQLAIYATVCPPLPPLVALLGQCPLLIPGTCPPFPARHPRSLCCHRPLLPGPSTQAPCPPLAAWLIVLRVFFLLQDPTNLDKFNVSNFFHVKNNIKITDPGRCNHSWSGARGLGASVFWVKPSPSPGAGASRSLAQA